MDNISIVYFLEDLAQEGYIKALVKRIAEEKAIPPSSLRHDVRAARHGSKAIKEFKNYLEDTGKAGTEETDILVVAKDANCKSYYETAKELENFVKPDHPLRGKIVYAIPDPHIERWYLMDQKALKKAVGLPKAPPIPTYKCDQDYYKKVLMQALKESGINSLLGGSEYAERIVASIENLDVPSPPAPDDSFQRFVNDLRKMLDITSRKT